MRTPLALVCLAVLALPAGTHDVTATAFGYATRTLKDVPIADGASVTRNITVTRVPSETVSGKVTDGSGHGWPLYARIGVAGRRSSASRWRMARVASTPFMFGICMSVTTRSGFSRGMALSASLPSFA